MTADVTWPTEILKPTGGKTKPAFATISGGRSLSGLEQVIANDAGFWRLTMTNIRVHGNAAIRAWNEVEVLLGGRTGTALVPALDCWRAPYPLDEDGHAITSYGATPHSDGAYFSDGSGYSQGVIDITAGSSVAARDTSMSVRVVAGGTIQAGLHFGVNERLYRVKTVGTSFLSGADTMYPITFWPPAREAIASGAVLEFVEPYFRCRLATDTEMDMDPDLMKFARPTLNWVEDV